MEELVKKLEEKGFKRWTKSNLDRMYINASQLGLELSFYNTGNIKYAEFDGEKISNCRAYKLRAAKTYIDLKTMRVWSDYECLESKAQELLDEAKAEAGYQESEE